MQPSAISNPLSIGSSLSRRPSSTPGSAFVPPSHPQVAPTSHVVWKMKRLPQDAHSPKALTSGDEWVVFVYGFKVGHGKNTINTTSIVPCSWSRAPTVFTPHRRSTVRKYSRLLSSQIGSEICQSCVWAKYPLNTDKQPVIYRVNSAPSSPARAPRGPATAVGSRPDDTPRTCKLTYNTAYIHGGTGAYLMFGCFSRATTGSSSLT